MDGMHDQFLTAYDQHADAIFRYCFFRTSSKDVAADLVQETFTKTWAHIAAGGQIQNLKAFLYRTAHNLIVDHYRAHRSDSLDALMDEGFDAGEDETDRWVDRLDGEQALALLSQLPKEYADAVYMRFVEGLSNQEIAEATGALANTVAVRVKRGLAELKNLLSHPK